MEFLIEVLGELIFEPFRLLIHWIVRSLGGSNPCFYLAWKYTCRLFILLSGVIFFGAIVGIITEMIGPFTMFWMLVGSPVLFVVASSASEAVVWVPPDLKALPEASRKQTEESPNSSP